ncbi:E3 ubiquitin-protein ligase RNF19B-like protein [Cladobotryum mycophilum]|uniref:RBR-type E3 ubiquitin transferase n=1 Tax=Cladobotryum mycophilum TaxID=491253 RepID=A0ABR0SYJ4_9HYPO
MFQTLKRKTEAAFRRRKNTAPINDRMHLNISWPLREDQQSVVETTTAPEQSPPRPQQQQEQQEQQQDIQLTQDNSSSRHNSSEPVQDEPLEPESDHNTDSDSDPTLGPRYVPFTETSAMKNNRFVNPGSGYNMVSPSIMGGFGGDDDSIWLVDDESTDGRSTGGRRSTSSATSRSRATTSSQNQQSGFRYNMNPALLGSGEFPAAAAAAAAASSLSSSSSRRESSSAPRRQGSHSNGAQSSNPYVDLFEQQEIAMTTAYLRNLDLSERRGDEVTDNFSFGQRYERDTDSTDVLVTNQRVATRHRDARNGRRDCIVCTEKKEVELFPQVSVTSTCTHEPNTCLDCIETSIRSDMTNKLWSDIRCPECRELLDYTDIQRYADKATFERYENLALRAAMTEAENFVWCTAGCGFGQIHDSGSEQPIVICLHCGQRSCFHHNVAWHENLTCEEYDQFLLDPENFRSRFEMENEEWARAQKAQRKAQRKAERTMAHDRAAHSQREREQREAREREERKRAKKALALAKRIAARRRQEEEESRRLMSQTTKPCPGCGWAIEKNSGW